MADAHDFKMHFINAKLKIIDEKMIGKILYILNIIYIIYIN